MVFLLPRTTDPLIALKSIVEQNPRAAPENCYHFSSPARMTIARSTIEKTDHRHRWLLRAHRQRPRRCRAADQRDERAAPCMSGKEHCEG
jgi:hypothetical protein